MSDKELIQSLGGPTKVAELLGLKKHGVQRVHNWTARGIPAQVRLDHPDLFPRKAPAPKGNPIDPTLKAGA